MNSWSIRLLRLFIILNILSIVANIYLYQQARWFADKAIKANERHLKTKQEFNKYLEDLKKDIEERRSVRK